MVTILEPGKLEPGKLEAAESTPTPVQPRPRGDRRAMSYTMPFPGVRYYAFSPQPLAEDWLADLEETRQTLPVKLIDERVILL